MKVTKVTVKKIENQGTLVADAHVVLDGEFVLKGIKIIKTDKGTFVAMPDKKDKQGKYHEVFHPITKEFRDKLVSAVLTEYEVQQ